MGPHTTLKSFWNLYVVCDVVFIGKAEDLEKFEGIILHIRCNPRNDMFRH